MNILIHPSDVPASAALTAHVVKCIEHALNHAASHVTRVDVHLHDDNSHKHKPKTAPDQRCVVEVHLAKLGAMAVSDRSGDLYAAVTGVAGKLRRIVEKRIGRSRHR